MDDYINRFRRKIGAGAKVSEQIEDLIAESTSKIEVYLEGNENAIPVAFINNDKEGVDEAIIYTYSGDGISVGTYFTWQGRTYLVYKEIKNIKRENYIDSFHAVKCNINFDFNGSNVKAFFRGPMRLHRSVLDEASQGLGFDANMRSVVLVPSSIGIKILTEFYLDGTGWRVETVDRFTTPGISYLNVALKNLVNENKVSINEPIAQPLMVMSSFAAPIEELDPGITYTFDTEDAYIKSSVPINIKERRKTSIKFIIPFGTKELEIETKQSGEIIKKSYKVK